MQPRRLGDWTYAPPVVATSLRVDGVERPLPAALTIGARERGFRLDFAALDFTAPERNAYRYRLDGYDRDGLLRQIRCPALLMQADLGSGGMLTNEDAAGVATLVADCAHVRLRGAGHLLHWERTQEVANLVMNFLETVD